METTKGKKISWFGLFQGWVDNLFGPSWLWFLLMGVLLFFSGLIILGFEAGFSNITFDPLAILTIFQLCYMLALINFLDKQAVSTLEGFQPQLKSAEINYSILKDKFTYLPPKTVNRITLFTGLFFIVVWYSMFIVPASSGNQFTASEVSFTNSAFGYYSFFLFFFMWLTNIIFIYHTIRQIRALGFVFSDCLEVNIFQQTGLYSFTRLGASTGIGLVLSTPIWLILDPGPISLFINIVFSIGAIFIFLFPLVGVHNLLHSQKSALLAKSQKNKEEIINTLNDQIDQNDYSQIGKLKPALEAVSSAHNEIKNISTWPWDNETIRRLSGAILLPIVIWLIQFFLSNLLSF